MNPNYYLLILLRCWTIHRNEPTVVLGSCSFSAPRYPRQVRAFTLCGMSADFVLALPLIIQVEQFCCF